MIFQDTIEKRRSIRRYLKKKVSKADIEQLLDAARMAESWKNSQTPRYHIIMNDELLKNFKEQCLPQFNANNCADAPVIIVATFKHNRAGFQRNGSPDNELKNGWGIYDTALSNQNFILKATELGLGTLVMGIRDEKAIRNLLNIPADETIVSVISLGYPDIDPEMPKRKSNIEIATYYE